MASSPMYSSGDQSSGDDYQSAQDAECLRKHAEITADPDRHQAAHTHLMKQTQMHQDAVDNSHKQLRQKVKKGLKQAFPSNLDKPTPFEEAGKE